MSALVNFRPVSRSEVAMSCFKKTFTFEDIDEISFLDYGHFREDQAYCIKIVQSLGLLTTYCKCSCGGNLAIKLRHDTNDGYQNKCIVCKKRTSIRNGTIFEWSKLPLCKSLLYRVCTVKEPMLTYESSKRNIQISFSTTND